MIKHSRSSLDSSSSEPPAHNTDSELAWEDHVGLLGSMMQTALDEGHSVLSHSCAEATPNWQQQLWLAGGDDDEYYYVRDFIYPPELPAQAMVPQTPLTDTQDTHMCIPRFLRRFYGRGAVSIERLFYGGRYLQAHPLNQLVAEVYTHRWLLSSDLGKVLAQVCGWVVRVNIVSSLVRCWFEHGVTLIHTSHVR